MEVDIVMNSDTPLSKAHDLSQELQDKLEALPRVERAFVHVDHETAHIPVRQPIDLVLHNEAYDLSGTSQTAQITNMSKQVEGAHGNTRRPLY